VSYERSGLQRVAVFPSLPCAFVPLGVAVRVALFVIFLDVITAVSSDSIASLTFALGFEVRVDRLGDVGWLVVSTIARVCAACAMPQTSSRAARSSQSVKKGKNTGNPMPVVSVIQ
jgi:hypothetical protein